MKVVIAPDSFKESMTAYEACLAIQEGIHQWNQYIKTELCPLADGGEGTLETLVHAMNGKIEYFWTHGPLMDKIQAPIGFVDDIAIIECAKVCGLELLTEEQKNPYLTSTYGLGELIQCAINKQVKQIMICLGGSATNDGGIGMLQALGVHFLDQNSHEVLPTMQGLFDVKTIDMSHMQNTFENISMIGVCDVNNPLCGENGATYIYGPQKGIKLDERAAIDQAMKNYAEKIDCLFQHDYMNEVGAGAAGGLGYALQTFCHARLKRGFEIVSETLDLETKIKNCDVVIVGEGKIDRQTQYGKTPYGVLKIAKKYHKKVYAFAGRVEDYHVLKELGFHNIYQISLPNEKLAIALKNGKENLKKCVYQHMEEIK